MVQDFLPYFREGASNAEIRQWLPSLSDEEIKALKDYIQDHYEEVSKTEVKIKAYFEAQRAAQPEWTRANDHISLEERRMRLLRLIATRQSQKKAGAACNSASANGALQ